MTEFLHGLNTLESIYLLCAFVGGLFFIFRLALQFLGVIDDFHGDIDAGGLDAGGLDAGGIDTGGFEGHLDQMHPDSDVGFKLLTLQGLTAFFMMFGLMGYTLYHEMGVGVILSLVGAVAAGLAIVWLMGKVMSFAKKMQSSGTLDNTSAIGGIGKVYLTIPENGTGRVIVNFRNRSREFDATSQDKSEIKTGERIKVVWVDGSVLVVEKV